MKLNKSIFAVSVGVALAALLIGGCSTPMISFETDMAGEIKLTGVIKIALVNFNSMPDDPFSGVVAADKETCALVRRAVGSAFYTSPMYSIADLDIENEIHAADKLRLANKRFDAFLYGRLWWQISPVEKGVMPVKRTLRKMQNVPVKKTVGKGKNAKEVVVDVPVLVEARDVVQMLDYNARNAVLMLSLSLYRVDRNGDVSKVTDIYQVTEEGFVLKNGTITTKENAVGFDDAIASKPAAVPAAKDEKMSDSRHDPVTGKLILEKKTVAMPTELQAKLMLASSVSKKLAAKLAPSKVPVEIEADYVYDSGLWTFLTSGSWSVGDERLQNLLMKGAFQSARAYSLYMLRNKLGRQVCDRLADYIPELAEAAPYPVPDSTEKFTEYDDAIVDSLIQSGLTLYSFSLGTSHDMARELGNKAKCFDQILKYLAGEDLDVYFFALGLTQEVAHEYEAAEESYRFAFNVNPTKGAAEGIQRARASIGESARLTETRKARNAAAAKTTME